MLRAVLATFATAAAIAVAALSPVAASATTIAPTENHRPVTINQSVTTPQDTPIAITLSATDADGDALTYAYLDFSGCHCHDVGGTSTGTLPNIVFTPDPGFQGTAQIFFQANDGELNSSTGPQSTWGIITITVTPPVVPAVSKQAKIAQCLHGGWKALGFRSQAACIVSVVRQSWHR